MKLGRILLGVAAVVVLLVAVYFAMVERGEVVQLDTRDAAGAAHRTRVWVVDDGGFAWLRTGSPDSPWLARVRANPDITVTRGGESRAYHAVLVDDSATRDRINALELEKYGISERFLRLMIDTSRATPVRLEPR